MSDIPKQLANAMGRGDCVLWTGAGLGDVAGRPQWPELLQTLVGTLPENRRPPLEALLRGDDLWPVLSYIHRHFGDEPLARVLDQASQAVIPAPERARALVRLRWRACFATLYADILQQAFLDEDQGVDVIAHTDAHNLTLRGDREPFILRTPPAGRVMRADAAIFDLVEEIVRTRTLVLAGFRLKDPDLRQILDLLQRIGRGNEHYLWMAGVGEPEIEEFWESFRLNVLPMNPNATFGDIVEALARADQSHVAPSEGPARLAALDLARAMRDLDVRADLALDAALGLEPRRVQELIDAVDPSLEGVDPGTLLRLGAFMLAHDRARPARRYFQQVVSRGAGREYQNIARLNLAFVSFLEGDAYTAVAGFTDAAEADHGLALVPPRFQIVEVLGRDGPRTRLACQDRETGELLDIEVATLPRPVSEREQNRFYEEVQRLTSIEHVAIKKVRGGFADGRLFGVLSEPAPGFVLDDSLRQNGKIPLDQAFSILGPLMDGLHVCHRRGVVHRNITPSQILVGPDGPLLRGFGCPPVVSYQRASIRRQTHGYAAPEVLAGGEPTARSDVYGLAAVLYRCVTGVLPVGSVPAASTYAPDVPRAIDRLLARAMHPDPGQRPTPIELRTELLRILSRPESTARADAANDSDEDEESSDAPRMSANGASGRVQPRLAKNASNGEEPDEGSDAEEDLESWAWVLERDPHNQEAWDALDRLEGRARKHERWNRVADVLLLRVEAAQEAPVRVRLLRELADIFAMKLSSPSSAFDTLQMLLEDLPSDGQVQLMEELVPLARESNNWDQLADSLTMVAARVADGGQRARLFRDLGWVCAEHLQDSERALKGYERALEIEPRSVPTLEIVTDLARKLERYELLVSCLISLAEVDDGSQRKERLVEALDVLERKANSPKQVLEVLPSLRDAAAGDPDLEALTAELAQRVQ